MLEADRCAFRHVPRLVYIAVASIAVGCPELKLESERLSLAVPSVDDVPVLSKSAISTTVPVIHGAWHQHKYCEQVIIVI